MKHYTVVVKHLGMCLKEDNSGLNNFKGDNYLCGTGDTYLWVLFMYSALLY